MLRLSRLAQRSALLRSAPTYARTGPLIARAAFPAPLLIRRAYSDTPDYIVRWNSAQQTFVRQLLAKVNSPAVAHQIEQLGPDKVAEYQRISAEVSIDGARDNLSIGRFLAFLSENNVLSDSSEIVEEEEELDEEAMAEMNEMSEEIDAELSAALEALQQRYTQEYLESLSEDEVFQLIEQEEHYMQQKAARDGTLEQTEQEGDYADLHEEQLFADSDRFPANRLPDKYNPEQETYHYWPDLSRPDPLMDSRDILDLPPDGKVPFHNRVVIRNHESFFHEAHELEKNMRDDYMEDLRAGSTERFASDSEFDEDGGRAVSAEDEISEGREENESTAKEEDEDDEGIDRTETDLTAPTPDLVTRTGIDPNFLEMANLHVYRSVRRVSRQTGKGKIARVQFLTIVGNGDGLVGYGKGTHEEGSHAMEKAYSQAIKNMDYVDRFENRTVWTLIETKFGSCKVIIRPRPLGFGLRCGPTLHRVFRAAGIKDISAKVWKSRNKGLVTQAVLRMLQSGHNPLGKGNGKGGPGRRLEKGTGLRNSDTMSRARGRYIAPLRK